MSASATASTPGTDLTPRLGRRPTLLAAATGVVSAGVVLAVAEAAAILVEPGASPLLAVGSWVIDLVPPWVKDTAIALFGTGDKAALLVGLGLLVALLAVAAGVLEYRRPPLGAALLGLVAAIALIGVMTRAEADATWALPTVLGAVAGGMVLRVLARRLRWWMTSARLSLDLPLSGAAASTAPASVDRRAFLRIAVIAGAASLAVGVGARVLNASRAAASVAREALRLPAPATPAPPIPAGAELGIDGLAPLVTPNADFYRIDTALTVPVVDPATWRLRIGGEVENPVEIGFDELLALPLVETAVTLTCVSNEVGGDLIGTATWLGYPIRELLARARPRRGADMVLSRSADGWTASTPLEVLQDSGRDAILAVGMNGEPLPLEHGFPVRMVVPGLYGYVSATKWVTELTVTRFSEVTAYWTDRGWAERGPIKTSSRIDVPRDRARVAPGPVAVAGVAWAQHTGIDGVEVRVDDGAWRPARLADPISADTWRQWVFQWEATPGEHELAVRATDSAGSTQRSTRVPVVPDGAEGWHTIRVSVG